MSDDVKWFAKHDFSEYRGKFIAIIDQKVVASGENAIGVWEKAKKLYPEKTPTITSIPRGETLILWSE
ncbi:MAG: DUF5678 domain-containing protein [Methanosarcinales archaeon]